MCVWYDTPSIRVDFLFEKKRCVLDFCDPIKEQRDTCGAATSELCRTFMGTNWVSYLDVGLVLSSV